MPTATEFEQYAREFEIQRDRISATVVALQRLDPAIVIDGWGGRAHIAPRSAQIVATCTAAARQCMEREAECRRRAQVCRAYTAAFGDYLRRLAAYEHRLRSADPGDWVGWRPSPPARPATWAERG